MMRNYIFLLLAALSLTAVAQSQKLSPNLRVAMERRLHSGKKSAAAQDQQLRMFRATLVATSAEQAVDALSRLGIRAAQITPTTLTATLSEDVVEEVAALPCIKSIELGAPAHPMLKFTNPEVGINRMHHNDPKYNALGQGYTGKGVVVGIVDAGFEYGHAAFRDKEGKLRISRVWEQLRGYGRTPGMFNYGTELLTASEILNSRSDNQGGTHGTHVACCAAGSDITAPDYQGAATDAELVLVGVDGSTTSSYILDAVKYIFDYATSVNKPCVVNLSLGSHYGPHDGSSTLDQAFEEMTGPGRIIVGSVGNEGDYRLHLSKTFTEGDTEVKTTYGFSSDVMMESLVDTWGSRGKTYSISFVVADNLKGQIRYKSESISSDADTPLHIELTNAEHGVTGYVDLVPKKDNPNGCQNIYIETHLTAKVDGRNVGIVINGEPGTTVHAWNCSLNNFVSNNRPGWTAGDTQCTVGEIGGTGRSTISVGAYQLRGGFTNVMEEQYVLPGFGEVDDLAYFSSQGPTVDGRAKPDVLAPGVAVCAAVSKLYYGSEARYGMEYLSDGTDSDLYYYYPMSGTSMSSPITAGIVACWLEANPTLTPAQIKEVLQKTSRHDRFTEARPAASGAGKIDAYRGLLHAALHPELDGIRPASGIYQTLGYDGPDLDLQGRPVPQNVSGVYIRNQQKCIR